MNRNWSHDWLTRSYIRYEGCTNIRHSAGLTWVTNVWKCFFNILHSLYDIWNNTKKEGPISMSRNIHKSPSKSCKKIVTVQKPKLLPMSCTSFSNIMTNYISSCIHKINYKWDIACFTAVGIKIRSSRTCLVYFDTGSNVLKKSWPRNIGAGQRYFWAGGNNFHLNFVAALQNHAVPQVEECILNRFYWS